MKAGDKARDQFGKVYEILSVDTSGVSPGMDDDLAEHLTRYDVYCETDHKIIYGERGYLLKPEV